MAGKVAELAEASAPHGTLYHSDPHAPVAEARAIDVVLSGTVRVDYEVALTDADGTCRHLPIRVEFPDEVRSMLEASTWGRGVTILEAITRLGATFIEKDALAGLLRFSRWESVDDASLRRTTFHVPLSYVRASLASVSASTV